MFKDVLNHMEHATWYAQAGLMIFVVVFVVVSIRAILAKRRDINQWAVLPLEDPPRLYPAQHDSFRHGE